MKTTTTTTPKRGPCTDGSETLGPGFQETLERSAAPYVRIECSDGSSFALPADVAGTGPDPDDFRDYVPEGCGRPESVEIVTEGVLWRLTAPGYMDSTEWTPADDDDDARAAAEDTYGPFGDPDEDEDEDEDAPDVPPAPDEFELSDFVDGAVKGLLFTAGLWSDNHNSRAPCGPGDSTDPADYFSADDVAELRSDCEGFLGGPGILEILRASGRSFEDAGADFVFTRNGEGAGFWDGDWPKDGARALTDWAHSFGTFDIMRGTEEDPDGPAVRWNPDGTPNETAESRFDPATDPARFSTHR